MKPTYGTPSPNHLLHSATSSSRKCMWIISFTPFNHIIVGVLFYHVSCQALFPFSMIPSFLLIVLQKGDSFCFTTNAKKHHSCLGGTQRYLTPEIPIGSPVMSRTTSEPSDGRSRKMVLDAAVFVHFAIVIPALHSRLSDRNQIWHTYSDGYGNDSNLKKLDPPDPGDFRGSKIQKSGKCHELPRKSIIFFKTPPQPRGSKWGF